MESVARMMQSALHLFHVLYNVKSLIEWGGTLLVCVIVFVETGFFVGFFLPGDSLLVTAGVFAATGQLHVWTLLGLVTLCAISGDQMGYWIGRSAGQALYRRENSFFFRKKHLARAHNFYETYGGKTVIIARFVPIVRTFSSPVAGAARMTYRRFLSYDIVGGISWVGSMVLGGYFLGKIIPNIGDRIHYVIGVVVFLSILPAIIGAWRARSQPHSSETDPPAALAAAEPERDRP
jgi:membrane-associated protein